MRATSKGRAASKPVWRATMKDVAAQLGISISTVSRALNNNPALSPKTIERVRNAAERSRYIRNNVARGLALKRSQLIGLIVSDISNPFFAEIARGAYDAAQSQGYVLTLASTGRNVEKEEELSKALLEYRVDGLILAGGTMGAEHLKRLRAKGVPFVVGGRPPVEGIPTVTVDNVAIGYQATKYLIDLGHKEIAFVSGPPESAASQQRLMGYEHAMYGHKLNPTVVDGDFTMKRGFSLATELSAKKKHPSATLAANDLMAIGLILGLSNLGFRVPEYMSVAGCDDIPMAALITPTLTTMKVPMYEIGSRAMERLIAILKGDGELTSQTILLGSELVIRDSTAGVSQNSD